MENEPGLITSVERVLVIGRDQHARIERRFRAAGYEVIAVLDREECLSCVRRKKLDAAVLMVQGSLLNAAELAINLHDLSPGTEILLVVDRAPKTTNRYFRRWLDHPLEKSFIVTRRDLQKRLRRRLGALKPGFSGAPR